MKTNDIIELTKYCLDECGVDVKFEINYNNRYVKKVATASLKRPTYSRPYPLGVIQIATKWWPNLDLAEQENTVVHEACHLASFVLDEGRVIREGLKGHGLFWQQLHRKCGREPRRYCGAPPSVKVPGTYTVTCNKCGKEYPRVTKQLITRRLNSSGSSIGRCKICKAPIYPPKDYIRELSSYQFSSMFDIFKGDNCYNELLAIRNS